MDKFCFFEIPVVDMERAVVFYSKVLEIEIKANMFEGYDMAFFPKDDGINGALIRNSDYIPSSLGVLLYLDGGDDLNNMLKIIEEAGGKTILHKTKVSDNHYYATFLDTEGNKLALFSKK